MAKYNRSILGPNDCQICLLWNEARGYYDAFVVAADGVVMATDKIHTEPVRERMHARLLLSDLSRILEQFLPF